MSIYGNESYVSQSIDQRIALTFVFSKTPFLVYISVHFVIIPLVTKTHSSSIIKMKLLLSALLGGVALGLDVSLDSFSCDHSLPFYAIDLSMKCGEHSRCTFGDTATMYGERKFSTSSTRLVTVEAFSPLSCPKVMYNDVLNTGIMEDTVYATAGLQFATLEYHLFEDLPLNMCGKWVTQLSSSSNNQAAAQGGYRRLNDNGGNNNQNQNYQWEDDYVRQDDCPESGLYVFMVGYELPTSDESTSWLATGWQGSGEISIYTAKYDSSTLAGYCTIKLSTYVTPSSTRKYNPPSAALTSGIVVAAVAALILLCIYCSCCRGKKKISKEKKLLDQQTVESGERTVDRSVASDDRELHQTGSNINISINSGEREDRPRWGWGRGERGEGRSRWGWGGGGRAANRPNQNRYEDDPISRTRSRPVSDDYESYDS
jgi:hypothetical protein